jgi:hypothetical protein
MPKHLPISQALLPYFLPTSHLFCFLWLHFPRYLSLFFLFISNFLPFSRSPYNIFTPNDICDMLRLLGGGDFFSFSNIYTPWLPSDNDHLTVICWYCQLLSSNIFWCYRLMVSSDVTISRVLLIKGSVSWDFSVLFWHVWIDLGLYKNLDCF